MTLTRQSTVLRKYIANSLLQIFTPLCNSNVFRHLVLVSGPLLEGYGSARLLGPSEADPLDHGRSEAPERSDWAPLALSSTLSERSAPHSAASDECGMPGGPAPDPGRYGWVAQPGRNGGAAACMHVEDILQ